MAQISRTANGDSAQAKRCVALALGQARDRDSDESGLYKALAAQISCIPGVYCENAFNMPPETSAEIWVIDADAKYFPPQNSGVGVILHSSGNDAQADGLVNRLMNEQVDGWLKLAKPVRLGELVETVHRLSMGLDRGRIIHIPGYHILPSQRQLVDIETGVITQLTDKECEIIMFLASHAGKSVDRETLLSAVWGYDSDITTHTLETHIYRLRQKIESASVSGEDAPPVLITDTHGYRLRLDDN